MAMSTSNTDYQGPALASRSGMTEELHGRRIVVPETRELDQLVRLLEERGAEAIPCPMIAIRDAPASAFIDLGDQFLALQKGRTQPADEGRHFGLVVDDKDAVRTALADAGVQPLPGPFLDFLDPWGNRIEIVSYENVQFTKAANVLRGMRLTHLSKNEQALKELTAKGMAPN